MLSTRKERVQTIWFATLLLLVFGAGCSDANKNGANSRTASRTVVSAIPPNGGDGACPNALVTATFSTAMNASSIDDATFTLTGPGSVSVPGQVTYDASSKTAIFTP